MSTAGTPSGPTPYGLLSGPAYHGEFVSRYDRLRPRPPEELFSVLLSLAPARPPGLVVDLGAGTGISTAAWSSRARRVIGIELNPEMLSVARREPGVEYRNANAQQTGLPAACADVVTCAQSFHWMPPAPTIEEIARILRPGGIFAAYDYHWPPLADWEVDAAFLRVIEAAGVDPRRPEKARHVENLRASGRFRAVREVFLHARQVAGAEEVAELPLVFGPVVRRLREGATERDLGLDALRDAARRGLDPDANVLWWTYQVRIAFK